MNTPIYADLDQIVFEGRSKDYGAYHMRERYNRVLTRASLIAFLLFISITALPKVVSWITPKLVEEVPCQEDMITVLELDVPIKNIKEPEVAELPAMPAAPVKTVIFNVPVPAPEEEILEEKKIAEIADLDSAAIGLVEHDGDNGGDYPWADIPTGKCKGCPSSEVDFPTDLTDGDPSMDTFVLLEKEPQPVNLDELRKLIGYPPLAVEAEIQGKVTLRVMVDKYGNYAKHVVLKNPHPILTKAVTDQIHLLKMTPGIQAGKPIKVWVTLPFNFELQH